MRLKVLALAALLVSQLTASEKVYATFDVEAEQAATLTLDVSGIVGKINKDVGDAVKEGELLMSLENSQDRAALRQAEADYKVAKIAKEHANRVYNRYRKLKDVIDQEKFENYLFDKEIKEAQFARAEASLKFKRIAFEKTMLKAPFDGIVSGRHIEVGDGVSGVQLTPLYEFVNTKKRKLLLSFDAKHWDRVKVGDTFTYRVDGLEGKMTGKIAKLYPVSDKKSRIIKAEVYAEGLIPGLFGDGYIEVE
jgi:RND family efflux transporter MFP subunit